MNRTLLTILLIFLGLGISYAKTTPFAKYLKLSPQELREEIWKLQDPKTGDSSKIIDIGRALLKEGDENLFKSGLDYYLSRQGFEIALEELEESNFKDDLKLFMLKDNKYFFDYDGSGGRAAGGSQAQPYLYLFDKYLPGVPVDPRDFDYPAKRKPLVDMLEAAMVEKRKPRELRRPDATDFEEQSGNHVGNVRTSESSSADASDFLKPVPIGIAAGVAAILALLRFRKLRTDQ